MQTVTASGRFTWVKLPVLAALIAALAAMLGGCIGGPANPSFELTRSDAREALAEMTQHPQPLPRPVVVLGGWMDPGIAADSVARRLGGITNSTPIIRVSFAFGGSFDKCRDKLLAAVDEALPSGDPAWTREVDVVAVSMGGLIARHAAAPRDDGGRRLRIARLFTIASPHQGAAMAKLPPLGRLHADMRPGSSFLRQLDQALAAAEYETVAYVRLTDMVVGPPNAAPVGQPVRWVPNAPLQLAHTWAFQDERIVADIARRLRGEQPYTTDPPAPLPPGDCDHRGENDNSGAAPAPAQTP